MTACWSRRKALDSRRAELRDEGRAGRTSSSRTRSGAPPSSTPHRTGSLLARVLRRALGVHGRRVCCDMAKSYTRGMNRGRLSGTNGYAWQWPSGSTPSRRRKGRCGLVLPAPWLLLWAGVACCGSEGLAAPDQRDESVARVVVTPASVALTVGDTVTLVATFTGVNGTALTDRPVRWSSSDPTIVSITTGGSATALQQGRATTTPTVEGRSGTAVVTVAEVPVARVVMSTDSVRLAVRTSLQLTAVTLSAAGDSLTGRFDRVDQQRYRRRRSVASRKGDGSGGWRRVDHGKQ